MSKWVIQARRRGTPDWKWFVDLRGGATAIAAHAKVLDDPDVAPALEELTRQNTGYEFSAKERR